MKVYEADLAVSDIMYFKFNQIHANSTCSEMASSGSWN